MSTPELLTEKFTLRPLRPSDREDLTLACQDPEIIRWCMGVPLNYTLTDADFYIEFTQAVAELGTEYVWAIDYSGFFAGIMSLYNITDNSAELGFWMAPPARRQGIATDAARIVLGFSFDPLGLGLDTVTWTAIVGNIGSEQVAEKLGFTDIHTVRHGAKGRPLADGTPTYLDARTSTMDRAQFAQLGLT